jgi:putative endonuclease
MLKAGYVYLMTNKFNTVIYTGVTAELKMRVYQHKMKLIKGFTEKYNINKLVYYEALTSINDAIAREKQIKAGSRQKKLDLITSKNPGLIDLYDKI